MKINGAEIIVACLKEQGVDTVFGFRGRCSQHLRRPIQTPRFHSPYLDKSRAGSLPCG